ncbi:CGNR zinc finger domain-containing protein [Luteimonas sp. RD2P54]|uniref:CGNR zinc finger domain-containing protein n=1 Tax=Luteimonas endophytica TaxID=3042023 RepID=A0ABT6JFQ0_9GAMM|nr:CGNR zinc finger domain-containing protein [Luteimonas endophytica]MDH5824998.1 CGNR zinc finger domain-containing protein [Luteimonas endophytica]
MDDAGLQRETRPADAPMVGDHLAMDLLNTQVRSHQELVDCWSSAEDVLRWLARHGIAAPAGSGSGVADALLAQARALRAQARDLIVKRKQGKVGNFTGLNAYLHAYLSAPSLQRPRGGELALTRIARGDALACLLGPVAEAVARLLVEGDFALVKQCEHPDCILWFYDRTKSHRRRWCSMATCGNRHKAARFRKKNSGEAPALGQARGGPPPNR